MLLAFAIFFTLATGLMMYWTLRGMAPDADVDADADADFAAELPAGIALPPQ